MPRLPGPDEPHFFARDPASNVPRTNRAAEDEAGLRALDSALLRRRAEINALDEGEDEFGPLPGPVDQSPDFDGRVQDLIEPFAGSRVEARARSLLDTHRKAFEARSAVAGHERGGRRMVKTLERILEDNKQAVTLQPDLIDVALARTDTALDKTATALDWPLEEREAYRADFDKDLAQRLLRADIAQGNARSVLQELDDDDLALSPETTALMRREAETAQAHARAAFQADAEAALADVDETAGAALIAQANGILVEEEQEAFAERVRQAQADAKFRNQILFMTPEAIAAAVDREADPLDPLFTSARERREAIAQAILEARTQDPAGVLMADPTVAGWFADGTASETALSRRLQTQREIGIETPKLLPRGEARNLAAELNNLPPAARLARLVELTARHGRHRDAALAELAAQGLDRPSQALAAAQDHPALAMALMDAQSVGRAKLREGLDPEEIDAVDTAVSQVLGSADTKGFRFAIEDLAFRNYRQTGDAELAAIEAVALGSDALEIDVSEPPEMDGSSDLHALLVGARIDAEEVPLSEAGRQDPGTSDKSGGTKNASEADLSPPSLDPEEERRKREATIKEEARVRSILLAEGIDLSPPETERNEALDAQAEKFAKEANRLSTLDGAALKNELSKVSSDRTKLSRAKIKVEKELEKALSELRKSAAQGSIDERIAPIAEDPNLFGDFTVEGAVSLLFVKILNHKFLAKQLERAIPPNVRHAIKVIDRSVNPLAPLIGLAVVLDYARRATNPMRIKTARSRTDKILNTLAEIVETEELLDHKENTINSLLETNEEQPT